MAIDPPEDDAFPPTRSISMPVDAETSAKAASGSPHDRQLKPGDVLCGRFVIIQYLARGGMGEVYEAADRLLQDKHYALKTLRPEIANDPVIRARFEREVLLAREVTHPNVCSTYDLFRHEGLHGTLMFFTMKLLRGESLSARLHRAEVFDPEAAMVIIRQMADALDAAHRAGVIHRDFKPGNVMLEGAGQDVRVSVTDFGLSRAYDADMTLAELGCVSGTLGYIAPEVLQGRTANQASDVYAFGVVLHEMLTGQKPVARSSGHGFEKPSSVAPNLARVWDKLILGCLEVDPARRYQSAGEALSVLMPRSLSSKHTVVRRSLSRRGMLAIAGAGMMVLALAGWMIWPFVYRTLHPLPQKRFVALMEWPEQQGSTGRALLKQVLDSIGGRLARGEASMKNLLVISSNDITGMAPPKSPAEASGALGANLVLAASVHPADGGAALELRVIDSASSKELRQETIFAKNSELNRLPERASTAAARLLDVTGLPGRLRDQDELANVAPAAFQLFNRAEDLMSQPNDAGLDQAIMSYQQALDADPRFALGYARLSYAYTRQFSKTKDRAVLSLAGRNADLALRYNPESPKALLSRALVDVNSGDAQQAIDRLGKAQQLDPGNPQILYYKARAYRDQAKFDDADTVYRGILKERPNYWPAYNERGWLLHRRGDYAKAAEMFAEGSAVAPQVALLQTNLGTMYLLQGKNKQAEEALLRSLERAPNEFAYSNLGSIAFTAGDYRKAIDYYSKARDLSPKNHKYWRNIGDSYAQLGNRAQVIANYGKAAELLSEALRLNPKRGVDWMDLAFYHAKLGDREEAEGDLSKAESLGASDLYSQFKKAQVLALFGRKDEALRLVLACLDKGLAQMDVDLALDLKEIRSDPRYLLRIASKSTPKASL
jgi:eukaryotic-like serine/threonine-protein kinase